MLVYREYHSGAYSIDNGQAGSAIAIGHKVFLLVARLVKVLPRYQMSSTAIIFVTVGTHWFDELVQAVDELAGQRRLAHPVVFQIGLGRYIPRNGQWFRTAPGLTEYYRMARLVIGHGGTGTVLEALELGVPFVGVSNPMMKDDHQGEFLRALAERKLVCYCDDLGRLGAVIEAALNEDPPKRVNLFENTTLARAMEELYGKLNSSRLQPSRLGCLLYRWLKVEIPLERIDRRGPRQPAGSQSAMAGEARSNSNNPSSD